MSTTVSTNAHQSATTTATRFTPSNKNASGSRNGSTSVVASWSLSPVKFFTVDIAGESILVTRNDDGDLRAFYNVCRHRGSVLCEEAQGTTKAVFQCPYHAWSYDLDGALVSTPRVGADEVDRSSLPLEAGPHRRVAGVLVREPQS